MEHEDYTWKRKYKQDACLFK